MIKVDYEGAWKELKKELNISSTIIRDAIFTTSLIDMMDNFEQKHTHNYIDIRKRSDKEVADYCLKKYAEVYMENINLKKKLKEHKEKPNKK
ncbi:hypothetical protein ES705_04709 [subsurface metagenome]